MKIREGFVSNSSSSSFIINKVCLTKTQLAMIHNHSEVAKDYDLVSEECNQPWYINETDTEITGKTSLDNFDMRFFMEEIGVPSHFIKWEDGHW